MILKAVLQSGAQILREASIENPQKEAALLLSHVTGLSKVSLIINDDKELCYSKKDLYFSLINRRAKGEPCAYLLGYKEFFGLKLKVNSSTLIPRPDTELLVEKALSLKPKSALDLGTGTGAIILALKSNLPSLCAYAIDYSKEALAIAKENARTLNLDVNMSYGSWFFEPMSDEIAGKRFDIIVSNPPYIEEGDSHLTQNGLNYEPITALTSGPDGLDDLRAIIKKAHYYLNENGCLLVEHGYNQALSVQDLFLKEGYFNIETLRDLGGNDRVTLGHI